MNFKKLFKDKLFEEMLKIAIITIMFLLFSGVFYSKADWMSKARDSFVIISTSITYFVIYNIFVIFKKPICVDIDLKNYRTGKNTTSLREGGKQRDDYSTIIVRISVGEINSAWSRFALKLIEKRNVGISICIDPPNSGLDCQPIQLSNTNIIMKDDGFLIHVNDILQSNLNKNVPINAEYNFKVNRNRDILINKVREFPIKPTILYGESPLNFFYKLFIDFKIASDVKYHTIELTA